jgi:hypothetical protein
MKFDSVELERVVERSLEGRPQWRPRSSKFLHIAEAAVLASVLGYWLLGLVSVLA